MQHVLVIGGAGFIGSHVARHVAAMGHKVTVLDDLSGGFRDNVPPEAELVEGSILDTALLDRLFTAKRFNVVFHLAAYAAEGLSHFVRSFNYTNNVVGSMNLISRSVNGGCRCFVFTSSIAVYGVGQLPMTEDMIPQPEDPYGIAKHAVERDLHAAHAMFGLNSIIFRPHNVYGEGQNTGDPFRNVIGIFMRQLIAGKKLTIFGDGAQTRAFTHIDDVAPVIARAPWTAAAMNQTFNVGTDEPCSINDLVRMVGKAMGMHPLVERLPPAWKCMTPIRITAKRNRPSVSL